MIFDLDPGEGVGFAEVVAAAHDLRAALGELELESFAKTTGGKGVHVVVPLERRHDWPQVKGFARSFAERLAADAPQRFLTRISKAERRGRIFIDYLRNDPTSTAIAPYSTRARAGAPVAMPVTWEALTPALDPQAFSVRTAAAWLAKANRDAWAEIDAVKQRLPSLKAAELRARDVGRR
jgi:bifunctional non-homologous end joining protein LigD